MIEADRSESPLTRERRRAKEAAAELLRAVKQSDRRLLLSAAAKLKDTVNGWGLALRAVSYLKTVPPESQLLFLDFWIEDGKTIRSEVGTGKTLLRALWVLLPRYCGQGLRLYRGDAFWNGKYGVSWTRSREMAEAFAEPHPGTYNEISVSFPQGRAVVLVSDVPAEAIISAPCLLNVGGEEGEYIVDWRLLSHVEVTERAPH
ncbi:hypothetical protein [Methylobacterium nigriterrae]|uniref:hypothetical protein n=1 Tax=Methylobacterium nigriterrae TaxID=3127512 RepID=UPI0030132510